MKKPQAIILAAGKGTRMEPLSCSQDKPLLEILGKSILEHNLNQLDGLADKVILVIRPGNRGKEMIKRFGQKYKNLKIKYIVQKNPLGTGDAIKTARPLIKEKFLLLNGDDLYSAKDIKKVLNKFPCILAKNVPNPEFFGIISLKGDCVKNFHEKPKNPESKLANTGLYYLPVSIFNFSIKKSSRGEYEFTDYIKNFIKKENLFCAEADNWLPVSFPWNILEANENFLLEEKSNNQGKVEKYCTLLGKVIIGKGTLIKNGVYIEGPVKIGKNCIIGPNCFIRKFTTIGDDCRIGQGAEIKNSVLGNNVSVAHFSYIGDSVIADRCNLGAGTITANWRHDGASVKSKVNGKLMDTERIKFGTVFGEGVKTGIGTLVYPGRKIWLYKTTFPGEVVKKDIR
jgi:UDP-N-acetylglucosamine diphosphorylase / glucose-1-phosphate thymidylyltransferase / UDP-N-acetylgalactosamine diphosphorylase / glucosamine-1-phosphate N-acetyltransferase / galactosamine-1-phosphate N-acetyltransferase